MSLSRSPADRLDEAERRIAWIVAHPGTSAWLKDALGAALGRDPVVVANDAEMLRKLLRFRAEAMVEVLLKTGRESSPRHS